MLQEWPEGLCETSMLRALPKRLSCLRLCFPGHSKATSWFVVQKPKPAPHLLGLLLIWHLRPIYRQWNILTQLWKHWIYRAIRMGFFCLWFFFSREQLFSQNNCLASFGIEGTMAVRYSFSPTFFISNIFKRGWCSWKEVSIHFWFQCKYMMHCVKSPKMWD